MLQKAMQGDFRGIMYFNVKRNPKAYSKGCFAEKRQSCEVSHSYAIECPYLGIV